MSNDRTFNDFKLTPSGIALELTPYTLQAGLEVQRAPMSGSVPGTWTTLAQLLPSELSFGSTPYVDFLPVDGAIYWYRTRHIGSGGQPSEWTDAVSGSAAIITRTRRTDYLGRSIPAFAAQTTDAAGTILDTTVTDNASRPIAAGAGRAYVALDTTGNVSGSTGVRANGVTRKFASGRQSGTCRNADVVTFSPAFNEAPLVILRPAAITHEPRAKYNTSGDGSGSTAYDSAKPTLVDLAAVSVTAGSFTCRARLKQPTTASTARTHYFTESQTLDVQGEVTTGVALANAPAANDTYTAKYDVVLDATPPDEALPVGGGGDPGETTTTLTIVVALESNENTDGPWRERATKSYSLSVGSRTPYSTYTAYGETMQMTVPGLDSADALRLKLKSLSLTWSANGVSSGLGTVAVNGYDNTGSRTAAGVTYTTVSGTENCASMTPASDPSAIIYWEAFDA